MRGTRYSGNMHINIVSPCRIFPEFICKNHTNIIWNKSKINAIMINIQSHADLKNVRPSSFTYIGLNFFKSIWRETLHEQKESGETTILRMEALNIYQRRKVKQMGKIIAIANQKGGVGKTTTSINLSAALAEKGKKVLVIDTDPQGNSTSGFGIDKNDLENTIYELILEECSIQDCIIKDAVPNVSVIPSNVNLAAAEIELIGVEKKEFILKNAMDYVVDDYDYIIIDCPPSLNVLTINSMTTANSVLVPIQCEYYALEGLSQLIYTVNLVKERLNPGLEMEGVIFTMYDSRTNLSMQVVENVKNNLNQYIFQTMIPRNIRLAEAPSYGMPIISYDPKSAGAESYMNLAEELISKNK